MDIPVMVLEIPEGTEKLIGEDHLKELMKTPAQRRSEKVMQSAFSKANHGSRRRAAKVLGRGIRMKCALGKFSNEILEQIDHRLSSYTRHEVFKQLQFMAGARRKVKKEVPTKGASKKRLKFPKKSWKDIKAGLAKKDLKTKVFVTLDDMHVEGKIEKKVAKIDKKVVEDDKKVYSVKNFTMRQWRTSSRP